MPHNADIIGKCCLSVSLSLLAPRQLPSRPSNLEEAKQLRRYVWIGCCMSWFGSGVCGVSRTPLSALSSLSLSLSGVAFDIDDVFVSFTAQKLCKMQSQQGAKKDWETRQVQEIASERCCCLWGKGYTGCMQMCNTLWLHTAITLPKIKQLFSRMYFSLSYCCHINSALKYTAF